MRQIWPQATTLPKLRCPRNGKQSPELIAIDRTLVQAQENDSPLIVTNDWEGVQLLTVSPDTGHGMAGDKRPLFAVLTVSSSVGETEAGSDKNV